MVNKNKILNNIVIGTAGHIDHGKTTLIKALSGIDTDKTKEEKKRGISINLGFAYFDLPSGKRCGIVDVPGHEKFIKNMLAGAIGINLVLLIVDAKEGIMPQTKEHFEILSLLGIKDFIVVITKIDLVDQEYLELVKEDVEIFLKNNNIKDIPTVEVDSISGKGINELLNIIDVKAKTITFDNNINHARINVDRSFQVKGFGTVITGTLLEGEVSIGDELEIYPLNIKTKVRNIQVHEQNVSIAYAGQRTAINLQNIKNEIIQRGHTLATPNSLTQTFMIDTKITLTKDSIKDLKLWDRIRVYIGTKEVMGRVVPLGTDNIKKGESGYAQIRLEEEISAKKYDKFIIRTYSPMFTIAGGVIIDTVPKKHKRFKESILNNLKMQLEDNKENLILNYLLITSENFLSMYNISKDLNLTEEIVSQNMELLENDRKVLKIKDKYIHYIKYEDFKKKLLNTIENYHKQYSLEKGILQVDLLSKYKNYKQDILLILEYLKNEQIIKIQNNIISLYNFNIVYSDSQLKLKKEIEDKIFKNNFTLPTFDDVVNGSNNKKEVLNSLIGNDIFILENNFILHEKILNNAKNKLIKHFKKNDKLTLGQFRDLTGSSRKYALLILEQMDKLKITKRVEDYRILQQK